MEAENIAKKRGRPATGKALTAAERQRAKRDRESEMTVECLSLSGLVERMQGSFYHQEERAEAWREYGRRMGFTMEPERAE